VAEATAVVRDEAMVEGMAGAEVEEFNLITPVRIIAPTPSNTLHAIVVYQKKTLLIDNVLCHFIVPPLISRL